MVCRPNDQFFSFGTAPYASHTTSARGVVDLRTTNEGHLEFGGFFAFFFLLIGVQPGLVSLRVSSSTERSTATDYLDPLISPRMKGRV